MAANETCGTGDIQAITKRKISCHPNPLHQRTGVSGKTCLVFLTEYHATLGNLLFFSARKLVRVSPEDYRSRPRLDPGKILNENPPVKKPTPEQRHEDIVQQIEHFNATGDPSTLPLTLFNQNGKWIGMGPFSDDFPKELTKKVTKLKIPKDALVKTDEKGKHLQGSYVAKPDSPLTIDFTSIMGHLCLLSITCPDLNAPYLSEVKGQVHIMSKNVNMPNLRCLLNYMKLYGTESLNIPELTHVHGSLECPDVKVFSAPKLQVVSGELLVSRAANVHVPSLTSIKNNFMAFSANTIIAPQLKKVGGRLSTRSAKDFYISKSKVGHDRELHPDAERLFVRSRLKYPTDKPMELSE